MPITLDGNLGITYPDVTLQNTSAIISGKLPTSRLPTGSVLQVVNTFTTTQVTGTASAYDMLSTSITPTSATSKILLIAHVSFFSNVDHVGVWFVRNSTDIARNSGASYINSTVSGSFDNNNYGGNPNASYGANPMVYLDSPATTSSVTYLVRGGTTGAGSNWFYNRGANLSINAQASTSSLILMEIAA